MSNPLEHTTAQTPLTARATNVRWQVFGLSCAASWTLYVHRYVFALAMPSIGNEWGLDTTELGGLQSAFYATYLSFQIPAGVFADWAGPHLFLGGIIIAWSIVLALHAWAPNYRALFGVRMLFGAAQAGCYPALGRVSRLWFPSSIRTSLQGWVASFFGRMGGATSNLIVAPSLFGYLGMPWRETAILLAAGGVILGLLVLVVLRNTPAEHPRVNAAELRIILETPLADPRDPDTEARIVDNKMKQLPWWQRLTPRSMLNLSIFLLHYFACTFADALYVAWLPYVLKDVHGVTNTQMGLLSALPLIGGALGGLVGGYLNDLWIPIIGRRWARSTIGFAGNLIACGFIIAALALFENEYALCGLLFCAKLFSDWDQPTVWGSVTDIGGQHTATIFGVANGVGGIGALVGPVALGWIAKYYDWTDAIATVAVAYLVSGLCWLAFNCTVPVLEEGVRPEA
ncbi:MAG TPA: MFS transporter [Pirellulales bacterium]